MSFISNKIMLKIFIFIIKYGLNSIKCKVFVQLIYVIYKYIIYKYVTLMDVQR